MSSIETQLLLSRLLYFPVLAALATLLLWALLELGGYSAECLERRRRRRHWDEFAEKLIAAKPEDARRAAASFFERSDYPGFVAVFARKGARLADSPAHLGKLVAEIEIDATHGYLRMNLGVRLGPALGLIGTLIPMGPALLGLSAGDVGGIADNLAAAFTTTILGLGVSSLCYFISVGRRHWYARDLSDIEHVQHFLGQPHALQEAP